MLRPAIDIDDNECWLQHVFTAQDRFCFVVIITIISKNTAIFYTGMSFKCLEKQLCFCFPIQFST